MMIKVIVKMMAKKDYTEDDAKVGGIFLGAATC